MAKIKFKTVSDLYGITNAERFVQVNAAGIAPGAGAKAAEIVDHGSLTALKFANGSERLGGLNLALPSDINITEPVNVRIGWSCGSNTGNVRLELTYLYLAQDVDTLSAGTDILVTEPVNANLEGYKFTSFNLALPSVGDRVVGLRLTRFGADVLDTAPGDFFLYGMLYAYTNL